jgi:hypothetical protein
MMPVTTEHTALSASGFARKAVSLPRKSSNGRALTRPAEIHPRPGQSTVWRPWYLRFRPGPHSSSNPGVHESFAFASTSDRCPSVARYPSSLLEHVGPVPVRLAPSERPRPCQREHRLDRSPHRPGKAKTWAMRTRACSSDSVPPPVVDGQLIASSFTPSDRRYSRSCERAKGTALIEGVQCRPRQ